MTVNINLPAFVKKVTLLKLINHKLNNLIQFFT